MNFFIGLVTSRWLDARMSTRRSGSPLTRLVAEHLARLTPLASAVPEATGEATVERGGHVTLGLLEAVMAGRMPVELGMRCLEVAQKAMENIVSVDLALEAAGFNQGQPPIPEPRGTTGSSKARPAWLKPAPGKKDKAACWPTTRWDPSERRALLDLRQRYAITGEIGMEEWSAAAIRLPERAPLGTSTVSIGGRNASDPHLRRDGAVLLNDAVAGSAIGADRGAFAPGVHSRFMERPRGNDCDFVAYHPPQSKSAPEADSPSARIRRGAGAPWSDL